MNCCVQNISAALPVRSLFSESEKVTSNTCHRFIRVRNHLSKSNHFCSLEQLSTILLYMGGSEITVSCMGQKSD